MNVPWLKSRPPNTHRFPTTSDSPHLPAILQEAWRNVVSGTSRAFIFGILFMLLCGSLALAQTQLVIDFIRQATLFRDSGAAIQIVSLNASINGQQCDQLAQLPGIIASGALRTGPDITLATLPSTPIKSLEATPGLTNILTTFTGTPNNHRAGVWVAANLAERAGITPTTTQIPLADATTIPLAGSYPYPNDGRAPVLDYTIVSPIITSTPFDACWIFAWPDPAIANDVLTLPVLPQTTTPTTNTPQITTAQLNTTLGLDFAATTKYAALPLTPLRTAAAIIGVLLGFTAIRTRRLELAATLHTGMSKPALTIQTTTETLIWLTLATLPILTTCLGVATTNTPDWPAAFTPAAVTTITSAIATTLGTLTATAFTKENHLFHYFKHR